MMSGVDQLKGPVPPEKHEQFLLGVTPQDIENMLELLGLTYSAQEKAHVGGSALKILEKLVLDFRDVFREILNQSKLKISASDRQTSEYVLWLLCLSL